MKRVSAWTRMQAWDADVKVLVRYKAAERDLAAETPAADTSD